VGKTSSTPQAQAEDPSPTSVAADLGEEKETGIITTTLEDLSLEDAAEMSVDWEDITAELATESTQWKERRWLRIDGVPMAMVVLCLCVGLCLAKRAMRERDLTSLKNLHRN
jgi:hypothetical protein